MLQPVILVQPGPDPVEQGFAGIGQAYAAATALKQLLAQLDELIAGSDKLPVMKRGELRGRISTKPGLNRYLRVTPGGLLRIDKAKIKAEANLDGKYLLRCSDPHLPAADISGDLGAGLDLFAGVRDRAHGQIALDFVVEDGVEVVENDEPLGFQRLTGRDPVHASDIGDGELLGPDRHLVDDDRTGFRELAGRRLLADDLALGRDVAGDRLT